MDAEMPSSRRRRASIRRGGVICIVALVSLSLAGCGEESDPASCPMATRFDLSDFDQNDMSVPFRYPLDIVEQHPNDAEFSEYRAGPGKNFHAAEDYRRPAGTAVYAMTDGEVSFSGTMGGYGWLVIVDHPDIDLYSLYGHLSPSRWRVEPGPVETGDLLGYLGDAWENGGSKDQPLVEHLHLGVRTGQRADYPGRGEWRWMAGWLDTCPSALGWVQPSAIIAAQTAPGAGFGAHGAPLIAWLPEILFLAVVLWGSLVATVIGVRRRWPAPLLAAALVYAPLSWYMANRGFVLVLPVRVISLGCLLVGLVILGRRTGGLTERVRPQAEKSPEPKPPIAV